MKFLRSTIGKKLKDCVINLKNNLLNFNTGTEKICLEYLKGNNPQNPNFKLKKKFIYIVISQLLNCVWHLYIGLIVNNIQKLTLQIRSDTFFQGASLNLGRLKLSLLFYFIIYVFQFQDDTWPYNEVRKM
jgi:hypothetical protein